MELLEHKEDMFYPTDYLLSRLRSRKAGFRYLISNKSAEGAWAHLLSEYRWVYFQMNSHGRNLYSPVFLYNEIRTITLCLRYKMYEYRDIEPLLEYSIISKDLKKMLRECRTLLSCVEGIENVFLTLSSEFAGLKESYREHGLMGFEQGLRDNFLEYSVKGVRNPMIRVFFANLIDIRNITNLFKHIRWKVQDEPVFVHGGNIREDRLMRIFREQRAFDLELLVSQMTKKRGEAFSAVSLENSLLNWLTLLLERTVKDPLNTGNILNYLWSCYIETVNLGILFYGSGLDSETVERELLH